MILSLLLIASLLPAGLWQKTKTALAAPESWYLNDYALYKEQTLEQANEAYVRLRRAEISGETSPEEDMLRTANYLRRLAGLPPLTSLPADTKYLLSGPVRTGYTPTGSILRMPGEGYAPEKGILAEELGRDFLSYQVNEALFSFDEDQNGLTNASFKIIDPDPEIETETETEEATGEGSDENGSEEETESLTETESDLSEEAASEEDSEDASDTDNEEASSEEITSEEETEPETEEEIDFVPLPFYPYPAAGYVPANLIAARTTAWSVELNAEMIGTPDEAGLEGIRLKILDLVTNETVTRTFADGTLTMETTLAGTTVLLFTPPESSIFGSNYGDQAGFKISVEGLRTPEGAAIRNLGWQTIFFQPKTEQKLHVLSVLPVQNQVTFVEESVAPENLKLFTDFLPKSALCTSRESSFLVPLSVWESDAEGFCWKNRPNVAAFQESPIYEMLDNPNILKKGISLPFTFSEDAPRLTAQDSTARKGEDFTFLLSPETEDGEYYLYQLCEAEGKPVFSLRASRKHPADGSVAFPLPLLEADHRGIYFAVTSRDDSLSFSNFIFLDPIQGRVTNVTLPEGLIVLGLAKEGSFTSKAFSGDTDESKENDPGKGNQLPKPEETEEESESLARGRAEKEEKEPFFENLYQKSLNWAGHHKIVLYIVAGVMFGLTALSILLQMRERRTYRNPSSLKKKKPKNRRPEDF